MMDKNIGDYAFVDCMFVDFAVDKHIRTVSIVVEAYYPIVGTNRNKGLLWVMFKNIRSVHVDKNEEFDFDLGLEYSQYGNDVRANEIHSIDITSKSGKAKKGIIISDMLKMDLEFETVDIVEIDSINDIRQ